MDHQEEHVTADRRGWHFSREVSIPNVVTMLSLVVTAVWGYSKLDSRVEKVESDIKRVSEQSEKTDSKVDAKLNNIAADIREVNQKLYDLVRQGNVRR